jgi:endonuclease/exonuclease/phosphatase family metal-dependent hydrolase
MTHSLRIVIINLCSECGKNKSIITQKWIKFFSRLNADIIFLQEISNYNLVQMANDLNMQILNVDHIECTCVLINATKLLIIDNFHVKPANSRKPIYIGSIHLDDVPSLAHHLNKVVYKSSKKIPLSYSLDKVLDICKERRLPRLKKELKEASNCEMAIIAGDFNELSHLDLNKINTPVSKMMEKHGFDDTYRYIHPNDAGYTWPAGKFYKNEPNQRIDFIYTRNVKIKDSVVFGDDKNWLSDHKIVMTDIYLPYKL